MSSRDIQELRMQVSEPSGLVFFGCSCRCFSTCDHLMSLVCSSILVADEQLKFCENRTVQFQGFLRLSQATFLHSEYLRLELFQLTTH